MKIKTKNFTIYTPENMSRFGSFEISENVDWGYSGGLVFSGKTLVDYDGVYFFPKEIADGLKREGYTIEKSIQPV
jgi:hypothetical protein